VDRTRGAAYGSRVRRTATSALVLIVTAAVSGLALALIACGAKAADPNGDASADSAGSGLDAAADASADACEASSPLCPVLVAGGMPACNLAQAEQGICALAEAGSVSPTCSALSCGGGFRTVRCTVYDETTNYYYDPSGAFFAELSYGSGVQGIPYSGPCTFDAEALVCDLMVDAGCASGGQALDSGSPESSAD
jgi:hypothetical protein